MSDTQRRVLVVDDDAATRAGLAELFEGAGYECATASTFREALNILRTNPPDLLITDIRLGEYNGLQLVLNRPTTTAAIVITGFDDLVLSAEAQRHGAAYLVKPIDATRLLEIVRELLGSPDGPHSA